MNTPFWVGISILLFLDAWYIFRYLSASFSSPLRRTEPESFPPVSVIRPIRGLDVEAEENIRSAFYQEYPGVVQTIFVFDDEREPAVGLVERCIQQLTDEQKSQVHILFCGSPPPGHTGKQNAMEAALKIASHDIVVFADSDIRPPPDALRELVATLLASPENGSAFAPVVVTSPIETLGDAGYALMINGLYGPAARREAMKNNAKLGFIMGQFMALRKSTLDAIGRLSKLEGQLVDDMYMGKLIREHGLRNAVSNRSVPIIQHGVSLLDFLGIYRRWIAFSRSGLPTHFDSVKVLSIHRGILFWLGLFIFVMGVAGGNYFIAMSGLATTLFVLWSIGALHIKFGGAPLSPLHWIAAFMILVAAPAVYLSILLVDEIDWRGRAYRLDSHARLAYEKSQSPANKSATIRRHDDETPQWQQ